MMGIIEFSYIVTILDLVATLCLAFTGSNMTPVFLFSIGGFFLWAALMKKLNSMSFFMSEIHWPVMAISGCALQTMLFTFAIREQFMMLSMLAIGGMMVCSITHLNIVDDDEDDDDKY